MADAVCRVIEYHLTFQQVVPLAQVFVIFYVWDEVQSIPTQAELMSMLAMPTVASQYVL